MICSLYIQSLKTTRPWRSFQTLWMSCRNITVKSLPLPRLNILRLLSDLFACLLSLPNPFSWCRSWECHTDRVHLGAVSLRCGKVAWELPGLSGTSEGGPRGQPRWRHCCQEPWRAGPAWAVGPALYCLRVAIFAFCCSRDGQWMLTKAHSGFAEPLHFKCCWDRRAENHVWELWLQEMEHYDSVYF